MEVVTVETPEIGDRSYLVTDGHDALIVDPQRDVERLLAVAVERGLHIAWVVETHIHNDYLSGGLALARRTGAHYGVSRHEAVAFERTPIGDGDRLQVGELTVEVVATPGHTPHHLSYVVRHAGPHGGETVAVFSGGSLLYGTAGRTDLSGAGLSELLARAQWSSIRRLAAALPVDATVHPTHGFGSFCSAGGTGDNNSSTIGQELRVNPALLLAETDFVTDLHARLVAYPRYYAHMAPQNRSGVAAFSPRETPLLSGAELLRRVDCGEWVVDIRPRQAFAARHARGTINVEFSNSLTTYLGWVLPWGSPLSLLADDAAQLDQARLALARIGLDEVVAQSPTATELAAAGDGRTYPVSNFSGLESARRRGERLLVLDVRHPHEWSAGHLHGAVHLPVQDLEGGLGSLPRDRTIWVHCAAGYRAALASSLLDRFGFEVTLVDDRWDQSQAATAA
jgi:glyoxylase-like metal-dependent hydrolase (beta-lactamase superfamily II)/rhodanese-related sulfurtransferase